MDIVPCRLDDAAHQRGTELMLKILNTAHENGCSDIHIRAGRGVYGRARGNILRLDLPVVDEDVIEAIFEVTARRAPPKDRTQFEYSFDHGGKARYRTHAFLEGGKWALSIRAIPGTIPDFQALRMPPVIKSFTTPRPGLVLITGPTGSGKSTTAASLLEFLAAHHAMHIVTIEDPIEYRIPSTETSFVTQREVGRDVKGFTAGAYAAMREDPDVLFIGELRDAEAVGIALSLAESGHMVVSTFHTRSCAQTITRLVSLAPPDAQAATRERLADALLGIISQRLLPLANNTGRILATEALVSNLSVKEHVRDLNKMKSLTAYLERSSDVGMHSVDQSLYQLVQGNLIDPHVALAHSSSPGDFKRRFRIAV